MALNPLFHSCACQQTHLQRGSTARSSAMLAMRHTTVKRTMDPISTNTCARSSTLLWGVRIVSSTPLLGDSGTNLSFCLVDKATDQRSNAFSIDAWDPPIEIMIDGGKGWARSGTIALPAGFKAPAALLVTKKDSEADVHSLDYISTVSLRSPHDGRHTFPVHSWVSSQQGERLFFEGAAYLPKDTPPQIAAERQAELAALRGKGGASSTFRTYDYQVYDDLGTPEDIRPPLGGSKDLPYPRRLKTDAPGKDGLPYDEQFNFSKQTGFNGDALAAVAVSFTQTHAAALGAEPAWYNVLPIAAVGFASNKLGLSKEPAFKRFEDVLTLFKPPGEGPPLDDDAASSINDSTAAQAVGLVQASAAGKSFWQQQEAKASDKKPGLVDFAQRALSTLFADAKKGSSSCVDINSLLAYPEPKVLAGREGVWGSDLEFGRQALAGMNPCMLDALKAMPEERGSAISAAHVDDDLKQLDPQGRGMAALVAAAAAGEKPRLFIIDYWGLEGFWAESKKEPQGRCEHVGRCLLALQQKEGRDCGLLPIAIELAHRGTIDGSRGVVYSRAQLAGSGKEVLWRLAKAVFRSVDSGWHQLVSHWLRCHACTEPFLIALRRNMSILHPVTKLMLLHFRYTLNINANARQSLINAGGSIESVFTPGAYALRLSSVAYRSWRFRLQALPTELASRGMTGPGGQLWLDDYPYAQDGLDLWGALLAYFSQYLKLYYSSDEDVVGDAELQAWWAEVKEEGHGDVTALLAEQLAAGGSDAAAAAAAAEAEVWGFPGPIPTVDKLAWVLTTIAWTASGHHAAVNFGQYDYSSLLLNVSSLLRRPIPKPDDEKDTAYKALVRSFGEGQQAELLSYLADFSSCLQVMTTVKLLSSHADDEHTLNEPNAMLTDPAAVALNAGFINAMEALEMTFLNRNRDPANWTRLRGPDASLEYTLLYPSSKPGVTMRGVPYSVSI